MPKGVSAMNLPPIPPRCKYFAIENGVYKFDEWHFSIVTDDGIYLYHAVSALVKEPIKPRSLLWSRGYRPGYWRPLIAAVARCAWIDEAERVCIDGMIDNDQQDEPYETAIGNARLWKDWGEQ